MLSDTKRQHEMCGLVLNCWSKWRSVIWHGLCIYQISDVYLIPTHIQYRYKAVARQTIVF